MKRAGLSVFFLFYVISVAIMAQCPPVNNQFFLNSSLEEMNCCPDEPGMIQCISDWYDPRDGASSDYFHRCDFMGEGYLEPPPFIPDGEGCVGIHFGNSGGELIMTCTPEPLSTDESYIFSAYIGYNYDNNVAPMNPVKLALYGDIGNCSPSLFSEPCPPVTEWVYLTDISVVIPNNRTSGWVFGRSDCFIPDEAYNRFIIGSDCATGTGYNFLDKLELRSCRDSISVDVDIQSSCTNQMNGAINLSVSGGTAPYTFDWDNDGTGDNDDPEDLTDLVSGFYQVVITDLDGFTRCFQFFVPPADMVEPEFDDIGPLCEGDLPIVLPVTSQNNPPLTGLWDTPIVPTNQPGTFDFTFTANENFCTELYSTEVKVRRKSTTADTLSYVGCEQDGHQIVLNGTIYNESNPVGTETMDFPDVCDSTVHVNMAFHEATAGIFSGTYCENSGFSIELNGTEYNIDNPVGQEKLQNSKGCDSIVNVQLKFLPIPVHIEQYEGCSGDGYEVKVNNKIYSESKPTGIEQLTASNGCDSLVRVQLYYNPIFTDTFSRIGCEGDGFSIDLAGQLFDEQNPTGLVLYSAVTGCDSQVYVNLEFSDMAVLPIQYEGCKGDGYQVEVNGTIYNESNPSGTELLSKTVGCDTLAQIDLHFADSVRSKFEQTHCMGSGFQLVINGNTYDENRPSGREVLMAGSGCDSIVYIDLNFSNEVEKLESYTGCEEDGYQIVVNGTLYDESNPSGEEVMITSTGCDSIVKVELDFLPTYEDRVLHEGCEGDGFRVEINNVVYDESNPSGVEYLVSASGCDSIVRIDLEFTPVAYHDEIYRGCIGDGYEVTVNGTTYNESNPSGTEQLISGSGCDSIVRVDLDFLDEIRELRHYTPCSGDGFELEVNGTIYNENHPSGSERFVATNGCDSVVDIELEFIDEIYEVVDYSGCSGDGYEVLINGTSYNEANPQGLEVMESVYGCDSILAVELVFNKRIERYVDMELCGEDDFELTIGSQTFDRSSPTGEVLVPGATGCDTLYQVDLKFRDSYGFSQTFSRFDGEPVVLDISQYAGELSDLQQVEWIPEAQLNCLDCLAPEYSGEVNTEYAVVLTDEYGCAHTGRISVVVEKESLVFIPGVFSPNNDGVNDIFQPLTSPGRHFFVESFEIFNRWGGTVFERRSLPIDDFRMAWDGTRAGAIVTEGVYAYVLRLRTNEGTQASYRGAVTLVR